MQKKNKAGITIDEYTVSENTVSHESLEDDEQTANEDAFEDSVLPKEIQSPIKSNEDIERERQEKLSKQEAELLLREQKLLEREKEINEEIMIDVLIKSVKPIFCEGNEWIFWLTFTGLPLSAPLIFRIINKWGYFSKNSNLKLLNKIAKAIENVVEVSYILYQTSNFQEKSR